CIAQMARHAHVLEGSPGCGARADRAGVPPPIGLTVGLWTAMEVVPLHHAGEAFAFGRTDHVDNLALAEHARVDASPQLEILDAVSRNLADRFKPLPVGQTCFLELAFVRPRRSRP